MLTHVPRPQGHMLPLMCVHSQTFAHSHMHTPTRTHSCMHTHIYIHTRVNIPLIQDQDPRGPQPSCVYTACTMFILPERPLFAMYICDMPSPIPIANDSKDRDSTDKGHCGTRASYGLPPSCQNLFSLPWPFQASTRKQCPIPFPIRTLHAHAGVSLDIVSASMSRLCPRKNMCWKSPGWRC